MERLLNFFKVILPDFEEYNYYWSYCLHRLLQGKKPRRKSTLWKDGDWLAAFRKQFEKKYHNFPHCNEKYAALFLQSVKVNLQHDHGHQKYVNLFQRAVFYKAIAYLGKEKGHLTRWHHAAADTVTELAFTIPTPKFLKLTNDEINAFIPKGNLTIFEYMWPINQAFVKGEPDTTTTSSALEWDATILAKEQILIQPQYESLSEASLEILQKDLNLFSDSDDLGISIRTVYGRWYYGMYSKDKMNYQTKIEMPEVRL